MGLFFIVLFFILLPELFSAAEPAGKLFLQWL